MEKFRRAKTRKIKAERYDPLPDEGLTEAQVLERVSNGFVNGVPSVGSKSVGRILFDNIFNFCNGLTIALALLLVAVGAADYAVSSLIIFVSVGIGVSQEIRAKIAVKKLSLTVGGECGAVRGGKISKIQTRDLVLDDVYVLKAGMRVPVDSVILSGEAEIDEQIITGESIPVKKRAGDTVLAACGVVAGETTVRADKVGADCYIESVARAAKKINRPHSKLFTKLNGIIKIISCFLIPLAVMSFISNSVTGGNGIRLTVINTASSVLGMIPVGIFLLASTALAVGVLKLGKKKTLVQDIYGIEMLAAADTLLIDKTGTMTDGNLEIAEENALTETEYPPGEIAAAIVNAARDENQTALAFKRKYADGGRIKAVKTAPFSPEKKYSAVETENCSYVLGAPDFVSYGDARVDGFAEKSAMKCERTLALCRFDGKIEEFSKEKAVPIAVFALRDTLRPDVKETFEWFKNNGVDIKIVSGDNPLTVCETAKKSGIENAGKYINCADLSDAELEAAADNTVFGRADPERKMKLVKILQKKGRTVCMMGDGVNDVRALKEADCSVSLASANETARNVSRIVLLDDDFKNMPRIIEEGGSVVGNMEKVAAALLMKTMFVMFYVFAFSIAGFFNKSGYFPFDTKRLMLVELFVLGLPPFVFAVQPNKERVKGNFLWNIGKNAIPAAAALIVSVGIVFLRTFLTGDMLYIRGLGVGAEDYISSLAAIALAVGGFSAFIIITLPPNKFRLTAIGLMFALFISGLFADKYLFGGLFFNTALPVGEDILTLLISLAVCVGVNLFLRAVMEKMEAKFKRRS
ncbi:MAG: HAD-IC family P-type ATPase [Clostridiales bacterium]|jgi:cation-transporting ATPase E|nr:HAD-IC family P-type ATPase [Clostridiales bacterium]